MLVHQLEFCRMEEKRIYLRCAPKLGFLVRARSATEVLSRIVHIFFHFRLPNDLLHLTHVDLTISSFCLVMPTDQLRALSNGARIARHRSYCYVQTGFRLDIA